MIKCHAVSPPYLYLFLRHNFSLEIEDFKYKWSLWYKYNGLLASFNQSPRAYFQLVNWKIFIPEYSSTLNYICYGYRYLYSLAYCHSGTNNCKYTNLATYINFALKMNIYLCLRAGLQEPKQMSTLSQVKI